MIKVANALFVSPLDICFSDKGRRFSNDSNRFAFVESFENVHESFIKRVSVLCR